MSATLVDSMWGEVIIGPRIRYGACLEAAEGLRALVPDTHKTTFDAVLAHARSHHNGQTFGCVVVIFEDLSMIAINTPSYERLCQLIDASTGGPTAAVSEWVSPAPTSGNSAAAVGEDAVSATGTTGGATDGGNTDGASA